MTARDKTLIAIAVPFLLDGQGQLQLMGQRRQEQGPLNGLWEFPGGKIQSGESASQACRREFREERGQEIPPDSLLFFKVYDHQYPDRHVQLFVHLCWDRERQLQGDWRPVTLPLEKSDWEGVVPAANGPILQEVGRYLNEQKDFLHKIWSSLGH